MKTRIIKLLPALIAVLLLASCGHDPKKPGTIYMPDMTYSNAYETYSPTTDELKANVDAPHMSARKPVAGTIPRGWIPNDDRIKTNESLLMSYMAKNHFTHEAAKWQEEYDRAGATIKDPLEDTPDNTAEGKRLYEINCKVCHGEKGDGGGQIVELPDGKEGPFTSRPPAYATRLPQIKEGNVFYSVSYGKGMMGGYGFQLSVTERWQVIHYIKTLAGIKGEIGAGAKTDSSAVMTVKKPVAKPVKK